MRMTTVYKGVVVSEISLLVHYVDPLDPSMGSKKKIRTDYSTDEFTRIYRTKGVGELEKIASSLISHAKRGRRYTLACLLSLLRHASQMEIDLLSSEQITGLVSFLENDFICTKALKQTMDIQMFEFTIGMIVFDKRFHSLAMQMIQRIPECFTCVRKSRKIYQLLADALQNNGVELPRRTFTQLVYDMELRLDEWTPEDLHSIVAILTTVAQRIASGTSVFQLHDLLRIEKLNMHILNNYSRLCESGQGEKNRNLRVAIHRYLRALLHNFPELPVPELEGERPLIDKWRRNLLNMALRQFSFGFYKMDPSMGGELKLEAMQLISHSVFPVPCHFTFTEEKIHQCIVHAMLDNDQRVRKLAVQAAASLIYIAWLHVHADDVDYEDVKSSPLEWLAEDRPDILFELAEMGMLLGIVKALEWAEPAFREHLLEVLHFYAVEDTDCRLLEELRDAQVDQYISEIDENTLSHKEKCFIEVILSCMFPGGTVPISNDTELREIDHDLSTNFFAEESEEKSDKQYQNTAPSTQAADSESQEEQRKEDTNKCTSFGSTPLNRAITA